MSLMQVGGGAAEAGGGEEDGAAQQPVAEMEAAAARVLRIVQAVGERYESQNDLLSAVLLYESALAELGDLLLNNTPRNGTFELGVHGVQEQARSWFSMLTSAEAAVVVKRRQPTGPAGSRSAGPSLLRQLARAFTEELAVRALTRLRRGPSLLEQWSRRAALPPVTALQQ